MNNFKAYLTLYNLLTDTISLNKLDRIILDVMSVYEGNKIYVCGNGGSFSTAQHFAQDLTKIAGIDAECLGSNPSALTAYANDEGYKNVFLAELENKLNAGDMLFIISCSGNSKNIIEAAKFCVPTNLVIGLLGCDGGKVSEYCAEKIVIPSRRYDFIEPIHSLLCHYITIETKERIYESIQSL
jgi:D-sedoheptulose 7-phosphate isomerase